MATEIKHFNNNKLIFERQIMTPKMINNIKITKQLFIHNNKLIYYIRKLD